MAVLGSTSITGLASINANSTTPPLFNNSSGAEYGQIARAWVNFNGFGSIAIRDSFNVTSLSDLGVGNYTVNLSVNFGDTNYAVVGGGNAYASSYYGYQVQDAFLSNQIGVNTLQDTLVPTLVDASLICVVAFS